MSQTKKTMTAAEAVVSPADAAARATAGVQTRMFPRFEGPLAKLLEPRRRFDVVVLVDVVNGVLNGDPDRDAQQRIDMLTGLGVATDVSFKRVVRDTMSFLLANGYTVPEARDAKDYLYGLYMQHRGILNRNHQEVYAACNVQSYQPVEAAVAETLVDKLVADGAAVELPSPAYTLVADGDRWLLKFDGSLDAAERKEAEAGFAAIDKGLKAMVVKMHKASKIKTVKDVDLVKLNVELCRRYWDVRMIGAVASTGDSCGNVKGPWQVGQGHSYDPIRPTEQCITRVAITKIEDAEHKRQDMGRKSPLPYSLFHFNMFYNPSLAHRVGDHGITAEDLKLWWTCLYNFGRFAGSSMRGHVEVAGIYAFAHDHPLGNAHAHTLLDRVKVRKAHGVTDPQQFSDYHVTADEDDMPEGVELIRLYERSPKTTTVAGVPPTAGRNGVGHKPAGEPAGAAE